MNGLSDSRNIGIEIAKGNYVFFLDSDDYIENNAIEVLMNMMQKYNLDLAHINALRFKDNDIIKREEIDESKTKIYSQYEICEQLLKTTFITRAGGVLYKKELWNEIKFPTNRYFEDLATYYKILLKSNKIGVNSAKLYKYRINKNSITMNYSPKKCRDFVLSTDEAIEGIAGKYQDLRYISNIIKIKNYIEVITMLHKNDDLKLYNRIKQYIKESKKFIWKNIKYFNKKDKIKISLYFFCFPLLLLLTKFYRKLVR